MMDSDLTDIYFARSFETVRGTLKQDVPVCYAVFCRSKGVLCGVSDVLDLIRRRCTGPIEVRGQSDGDAFRPCEVVMTLEGRFGELVTLESELLGLLSLSAAAGEMSKIVDVADGVSVIDMAARHYPPEIATRIAVAAAVGGGHGTSTSAGHADVHARFGIGGDQIRIGSRDPQPFGLYGSIPHALNAVYSGSSIDSAIAYRARFPDLPLTVLVDYEGRELDVCVEAVERFGDDLHAVRLDTAGSRVHEGGSETTDRAMEMRILSQASDRHEAMAALERYGFGTGVTIEMVFRVRDLLNRLGARQTRIIVSGRFDLDKIRAFKACNAPMDAVGTGSWVKFGVFTSDIIRVHEAGQWTPRCKAGRRAELIEREELPLLLKQGSS